MRSKIASKILAETPTSVRKKVRDFGNDLARLDRLSTRVIVVCAESLRPMSFHGGQFSYVDPIKTTSVKTKGFKLRTYSRCAALQLIKLNKAYRTDNNLTPFELMLMLVENGK